MVVLIGFVELLSIGGASSEAITTQIQMAVQNTEQDIHASRANRNRDSETEHSPRVN